MNTFYRLVIYTSFSGLLCIGRTNAQTSGPGFKESHLNENNSSLVNTPDLESLIPINANDTFHIYITTTTAKNNKVIKEVLKTIGLGTMAYGLTSSIEKNSQADKKTRLLSVPITYPSWARE